MSKKLVLVDGAAGFVGRRLIEELIVAGYRVRATDLSSADLGFAQKAGAEVIAADLLDLESLHAATDGVDYVVHCAALFSLVADKETLNKVNVVGTENLLKACVGKNVKQFIHVSSSDIYGTLKQLPGDESHPQKPINDYAVSKKESEAVVRKYSKEYDIPATILRPSAIYGPGSKYIAGVFFFWPIFMRLLRIPFYPFIRGGSKLTFVHVDDVAGAINFLLGREEAYNEAYNLADKEYIYSANFAGLLSESFGIRNMFPFSIPLPHVLVDLYGKFMLYTGGPMLRFVNRFVKKRWFKFQEKFDLYRGFVPHFERQFYSYFIGHRYFSSEKMKKLGYEFRNKSFQEAFPDTFQWYVANKWLPPVDKFGKKIK